MTFYIVIKEKILFMGGRWRLCDEFIRDDGDGFWLYMIRGLLKPMTILWNDFLVNLKT